jgi:hypothetical protein
MLKRNISKTLDTHHNSKLKEFNNDRNTLEVKQDELNEISEKIQNLSKTALSNLSESEFQTYLDLTDQKQNLEKEVLEIRRSSQEVDYYVNTADLIFRYYDIVENGNILENEAAAIVTENSILKFFTQSETEDDNNKDDDRAALLDKYMQFTDYNYLKLNPNQDIDECPVCDSKTRTLLVNDGLVYCNDCHTIETVIIDHEKPKRLGIIVVLLLVLL